PGDFQPADARLIGVAAARAARACKATTVGIAMPKVAKGRQDAVLEAIGCGFVLGGYSFDKYKKDAKPLAVESVTVLGKDLSGPRKRAARALIERGTTVGAAVNRARDLVNGPANE